MPISSLIIIAIASMLILAMGIILFVVMHQRRVIKHHLQMQRMKLQKEREILQAAVHGEEQERTRIAAELHDDVGATLSSAKLYLSGHGENGTDKETLQHSLALIDDAIHKVRGLSHRLQPAILKDHGLVTALQAFFASINSAGKLNVTYNAKPLREIDENAQLAIYRIVQELMNNIIKHSGAGDVIFKCERYPNELRATLMHDGKGLTDENYEEYLHKKDAIGLKNIQTRLQTVQGVIGFREKEGMFVTNVIVPV